MTENIKNKLDFLKCGKYKSFRHRLEEPYVKLPEGASEFELKTALLKHMLESEKPQLFENDIFGFNRTISQTPVGYIGEESFHLDPGNVTPDYEYVLGHGMDALLDRINNKLEKSEDSGKTEVYLAFKQCIEICLAFSDRYRDHALETGNEILYQALCRVPHKSATSFYEACVFLKFIMFTLHCNRNIHINFGGFDRYMLKYYNLDISKGIEKNRLFEILEDFFIAINLDSDIYYGAQQGDNGMSMVLGGRDIDGNDLYSELSQMCLRAAMELELIDPKINLRVDKNTPIERLEFATELTKKGLGFPQYCNDDVVIPGLIKFGYDPRDAHNYTVAACWEFIIPGKGFDIPNIHRVNFPKAVELATNEQLSKCEKFEDFLDEVKKYIEKECREIVLSVINNQERCSPYLSVFIEGCIEKGLDISQGGAIYNNYGAHGVGISTAADIIAGVKKAVYDDKKCTAQELLTAIENNFEGYNELRNYLISCPKMGNNDDYVDEFASFIIDIFADVFSRYKNKFGGIFRPGTGSAMEYVRCASYVKATADGRKIGDNFGSSFSPSPIARLNGPLSCIQSFTKPDLTKVINGGPLTMEIHDSTFRNEDGVKKVAALVKAYIDLGGHQIQLNAINRDVLIDAQKNPEAHKNLIVRVWGWSGYFNELDVKYQDHIIKRTEFVF